MALEASGRVACRLHEHETEYKRLTRGPGQVASKAPAWDFTGQLFTQSDCNRTREITHGCGILPRINETTRARDLLYGSGTNRRISEVPILTRNDLQFGTIALAQHAGLTPRNSRCEDAEVAELKKTAVTWHQHDHERSTGITKHLRPMRVAGVNSARLGYSREHAAFRQGVTDRPPWMQENETLPGGFHFAPSDPNGDPTRFGKDAHFSAQFGHARGWGKSDATFKQRPRR